MSTKPEKEWAAHLSLANQNVERYRKGAAQLSFVTTDGKPVVGRQIQVTQKTQDFLFGLRRRIADRQFHQKAIKLGLLTFLLHLYL